MSDIYVKRNFLVGLETSVTATADNDIPNLAQVTSIAEGYANQLEAVRAASSTNIDVTTGGSLTVDGVSLTVGDRVLLFGQTTAMENGVWVVSSGSWSRADDVAVGDTIKSGTRVYVSEGTALGEHEYRVNNTSDAVVGTTALSFIHILSVSHSASSIDVSDTNFTAISGTTAQAVLDSIDDNFVTVANHVDALTGVTGDNLGTFTGSVISDNSSIKAALQELETEVESISLVGTSVTFDDTGNSYVTGANVSAALDAADVAFGNHGTALGIAVGSSDLGTFTGSTISDSSSVKSALQELETAVENVDVTTGATTVYNSKRYVENDLTLTANTWTTVTHSLNELYPSSISIYGAGGDLMTHSFNVEVIDANNIRIQNEYHVDMTLMDIVVRV